MVTASGFSMTVEDLMVIIIPITQIQKVLDKNDQDKCNYVSDEHLGNYAQPVDFAQCII